MQFNSVPIMEETLVQTLMAEEEAGVEDWSVGIVENVVTQSVCARRKSYVGVMEATISRETTSSCG